ncbi:unnamed protein product [Caretta caretta]
MGQEMELAFMAQFNSTLHLLHCDSHLNAVVCALATFAQAYIMVDPQSSNIRCQGCFERWSSESNARQKT